MNTDDERAEKQQLLKKVLGLGLIYTLAWASLLAFVPAESPVRNILDYVMYFMSVFVVALPTYNVIKPYVRNSIIVTVLVWAVWTFGVRYLFMWLMGMFRG